MKLMATGFSANSKLIGTLILQDDAGEYMGWEESGDWSNPRFQRESLAQMVALVPAISEDRGRSLISRALADARRQAGIPTGNSTQAEHKLPFIMVSCRQERDIQEESWSLLASANETKPEFFRLGSMLVHLEREEHGVSLAPLSLPGLRDLLKKQADFVRLVGPDERPTLPPRTMLEDMLAMAKPPVPLIVGISQSPVLVAPDRILDIEGYYADCALYIAWGEQKGSSPVPDSKGEDVAEARRLLLEELLVDFPFTSDADRAHAICALLSPILRPYIQGSTPLFLIEAPCEGSGKGLLCDIIAQVTTGGKIATMTEGENEDEWRKRLTAKLKTAPSLVCIDNVRLQLESAALSSALTTSIWEDREMGASRILRLPVRCTWLANGNNPVLSKEIARRTVRVRIDAKVARPSERSGFRNDLQGGWALSHRSEILRALLTLVKAWLAAGKPKGQFRMGSFQEWADSMGGILTVAGITGFLANREEVYALASQEDDAWLAFIEAWWQTWGEQRVGVDLLFGLSTEQRLLTDLRGGRSRQGASVAMGKELMTRRDRRLGNWIIRLAGSAHGVRHYRLENVEIKSLVAEEPNAVQGSENPNHTHQTNLVPEAELGGDGGDGGFISNLSRIPEVSPPRSSQLQRSAQQLRSVEAVLGIPVEEAIEIWRAAGGPIIHLARGVNSQDLAKILSRPDVPDEWIEAVRVWLGGKTGEKFAVHAIPETDDDVRFKHTCKVLADEDPEQAEESMKHALYILCDQEDEWLALAKLEVPS